MIHKVYSGLMMAAFVAMTLVRSTQAGDTTPYATISVDGMHCGMCAKKVVGNLQKVSGVAKADANVEQKVVTVAIKNKSAISPKAMWEAVEAAGYKPTKLVTPQGEYKVKPKS